jgi:energy-coupling factor transporter ATP-binding protein EcfA2
MAITGNAEARAQSSEETAGATLRLVGDVRCPGLSPGAPRIPGLAEELSQRLAVFHYKRRIPYLWGVLLGGTGTGKSTLFNAIAGYELSQTGVERPKTRGPIAYAHRQALIEENFPFPGVRVDRSAGRDPEATPAEGAAGCLLVLEHERDEYSHLVLVDTPDLDSVEVENRRLAQHLYLLADTVLFITSQEKYADEVPYQFLLQVVQDRRPCFIFLNKADDLTLDEVMASFRDHDISLPEERLWLIPYLPSHPSATISRDPAFQSFRERFSRQVTEETMAVFRQRLLSERAGDLRVRADELYRMLREEEQAAQQWLDRLETLSRTISRELLERQKQRFTAVSREYLQCEIRKLYARYDILARPRRILKELLLSPLRLLGVVKEETRAAHDEAIRRIRQKIDPAAVQASIAQFNRAVLEELSPIDTEAPLFGALRQATLALTGREVEKHLQEKQDHLTAWLEETFARLARGLPKEKRLGIYSTSVLWGVLILTFETAVGGGFSLLEAALDTVLAPLVTKGAVELFAYYELEKIGKRLAERFEDALLSLVREQGDRYRDALGKLMTSQDAMIALEALRGFSADRD